MSWNTQSGWKEEFNDLILQPVKYTREILKSDSIFQFIDVFNYWLKVPVDKLAEIKAIVQAIYISTKILRDLENRSELRNRSPAAHEIYGLSLSLNAANYVYIDVVQKAKDLGRPEALRITMEYMKEYHEARATDIQRRKKCLCPTLDEYNETGEKKYANGILKLGVSLLSLFTSDSRNFVNLADLLTHYAQVKCAHELTTTDLEARMKLDIDQLGENPLFENFLSDLKTKIATVTTIR